MILLSPSILALIIAEGVLLFLAFIALLASVRLSLDFNPKNTTAYQYALNKKSYLVATIIMFTVLLKIPLFFFFIWGLDATSLVVSGAMCAAGIVSASKWGIAMFFTKIIVLFALSIWILIHRQDLKSHFYPFTRLKFFLFQGLFFLMCIEFLIQIAHFLAIPSDTPVNCCSVLFDQTSVIDSQFFVMVSLIIFYVLFIVLSFLRFFKIAWAFGTTSILWAVFAIYTLIYFFSSYVYELPTHKCPFCLLQPEYYYVGYLVYVLIFLGVLGAAFILTLKILKLETPKLWYNLSFISNAFLLLLLSAYPIIYFLRNSVWL